MLITNKYATGRSCGAAPKRIACFPKQVFRVGYEAKQVDKSALEKALCTIYSLSFSTGVEGASGLCFRGNSVKEMWKKVDSGVMGQVVVVVLWWGNWSQGA